MTTSFRQQVLIYEQPSSANINDFTNIHHSNNMTMNTPRFVTMVVSLRAIYTVYITQGILLGFSSAILTAMCVAPLFFDVSILRANAPRIPAASEAIITTSPIVLFTQSILRELTISYHDEHSTSGRMAQSIIETLNECIHDLNYVAQVLLRENQGLLVLLIGGISTMALALVAGLDGVNGLKAVLISITCYGVTTILVARSARRIVNQQTAMMLSHKPKLSSAEVKRIVEAIPEETFVRNDDLETCDWKCLTNMLHHRKASQSSNCSNPGRSRMKDNEEYCTPSPHNSQPNKESLIANIQQRRNYNDTCCICLSPFVRDERIRVLPSCRHEFHVGCIDKWAQTFAADIRLQYCNVKSGSPTCPLCKTCL